MKNPKKRPAFADLADLPEDQRIRIIGELVVKNGKCVAFIVEDRHKAKRYIKKLTAMFPGVVIADILDGPVRGMHVTVKCYPASN